VSKRPDVRIPLFPADREARVVEALNMLFFAQTDAATALDHDRVLRLAAAVADLADGMFDSNANTADFAGPGSLTGADYTHPVKVAELAMAICWRSGMPRTDVLAVGLAGCLMNIGYLGTRSSFLDESHESPWDPPTIDVAAHPARSAALLADQHLSDITMQAIAQHHERWDGSGYPRGLSGDEITPGARALAIADTFISLRSPRANRPPHRSEETLRIMADEAGHFFEPRLLAAMIDLVHTFPPIPERTAIDLRMPPPKPIGERPQPVARAIPAPRVTPGPAPAPAPRMTAAPRSASSPPPTRAWSTPATTPRPRRRRSLFSAREYIASSLR
jgi:HD-GYP domain-containing protein (c-di-GMP phosphodiesterase class II)